MLTSEDSSIVIDFHRSKKEETSLTTNALKKLPIIGDFANKYYAFGNRLFLFGEDIEEIKGIYESKECVRIDATCSIEFLNYLKTHGYLSDFLHLGHLANRFIIDGDGSHPNDKFDKFIETVSNDEREYLKSITNHVWVPYREKQQIIYVHRNFCIVNLVDDVKVVLFTNLSEANKQQCWISWRSVDIEFYTGILNFISSNNVTKVHLSEKIQ